MTPPEMPRELPQAMTDQPKELLDAATLTYYEKALALLVDTICRDYGGDTIRFYREMESRRKAPPMPTGIDQQARAESLEAAGIRLLSWVEHGLSEVERKGAIEQMRQALGESGVGR